MVVTRERQASSALLLKDAYENRFLDLIEEITAASQACSSTMEETLHLQKISAYALSKRACDIVGAVVLLALLLPVAALIALAIRLSSPGPILHRQCRVGRDGRLFTMYKFRSMQVGAALPAEAQGHSVYKSRHDPRITRIGRLIRKTSLDEVPQLLNVLRGEMSFVGPRPELVEMLDYYQPEHFQRHRATPGLTGWWQTHGRTRRRDGLHPHEDLEQKLQDDLYYLVHRSFFFDLYILLITIPVVLFGLGAA